MVAPWRLFWRGSVEILRLYCWYCYRKHDVSPFAPWVRCKCGAVLEAHKGAWKGG